ncbi:protein of unknown function [Acidithiobacillus ferrivorans]|uniref:Uncharacterized protein n=1 Tax=Acidithiobacillus ferrivorans TaxID=160808 RepID=A0ABY1MUT4_9PROT|nr:protein of unknown function [Acidithiobacillus ferrivorans]
MSSRVSVIVEVIVDVVVLHGHAHADGVAALLAIKSSVIAFADSVQHPEDFAGVTSGIVMHQVTQIERVSIDPDEQRQGQGERQHEAMHHPFDRGWRRTLGNTDIHPEMSATASLLEQLAEELFREPAMHNDRASAEAFHELSLQQQTGAFIEHALSVATRKGLLQLRRALPMAYWPRARRPP